MNKRIIKNLLQYAIVLATVVFMSFPLNAQRRSRPGSFKHTDSDVENVYKKEPVKCTYIKDGAKFYGELYYVSDNAAAKMIMGTATLTLTGGKYKMKFDATKYKSDHPWRYEKIANDFIAEGRYLTYKQNGKIYIHMEDKEGGVLWKDGEIDGVNAKSFGGIDDNILFVFEIIN